MRICLKEAKRSGRKIQYISSAYRIFVFMVVYMKENSFTIKFDLRGLFL